MQRRIYDEGVAPGFSFDSLIEREELQRLQDGFCSVTGVCAYCVNAAGEEQTTVSGDTEDKKLIQPFMTRQKVKQMLSRVEEGSLEELAVEDTAADNLKAASMSIRIQGRTVINWVVFAVLSDAEEGQKGRLTGCRRLLTEREFYQVLDLLRESSRTLFQNKVSCVSAEAESMRSRYSALEMQNSLDRIEAMTGVVQLLDSDDMIEAIMEKVVQIVGGHLQVTSGYICSLHPAAGTVDLLTEWYRKGVVPPFDKSKNLEAPGLVFSEKPVIISSDTIDTNEEAGEWTAFHVRAFAIFPLMKSDGGGMCICFNHSGCDRIWTVEEVKFIADAVKVLQSILTKRIQKNSLAGSYASLEAVLDNVGCGIYVRDTANGKVLFANRKLKSTFASELQCGTFEQLLDQGIPVYRRSGAYEINYLERERWYDLLYTEIIWVDGRKASLYSLYDITDKKIYQKKIERQAYTDFLTGLYNRMCCERDLAWYLDDAAKNQVKGSLLYIDLDDFKHINDGLGHQYGDVLLKAISGEISRIEGIRTTCYRMGGDEFVVIIPPDRYKEFERIVESIRLIFAKPWFLKDADYYCTMSMGIVTFPDDGANVQEIIKKADIAMYEAKKTGKNRYARYSDSLGTNSGRRLDVEKNMRDATVAGYKEFEVYYQPVIDISQPGTPCTGAEALIRWNNAELGFIPPSEFIPLAEYLGLINPIGNHVLLEACKECKKWNDSGYPGYKVNVNLSVVQLLQADIFDIVERTIKETGIRPHNLTLEVTESLAINDMDRMKEILTNIKELGVRIALDDFGTGYSSLNHIREFPFDVIKVDQSFVKDLAEDAYSQSFIKMVGELAETIGVSICVEGIETAEQFKVLEGMKVKMVQGYYFDRPMTQKDFETKYMK
ncbi:MAG: bifunctional diguanylate cyclase/phosphodiesterase [Lachnospiraceae bacterium]|nr:bifunctional diguanylate cyclase/phosphodiesterase [Lachnospiraceae bacterium]